MVTAAKPPHTTNVDELVDWQSRLRHCVDELVSHVINGPFSAEFNRRYQEKPDGLGDLTKWTNHVLNRCRMYLTADESKKPAYLVFNRVRESDRGRIHLEFLGTDRRSRTVRLIAPVCFQLVRLPDAEMGATTLPRGSSDVKAR